MTDSAYLSIETKDFETKKKEGIEESKDNGGEGNAMDFPNLGWAVDKDEIEFRDGELYISGTLLDTDLTNFGYLSTSFSLGLDTIISMIEFYMKKLGKLKTVLEATK